MERLLVIIIKRYELEYGELSPGRLTAKKRNVHDVRMSVGASGAHFHPFTFSL